LLQCNDTRIALQGFAEMPPLDAAPDADLSMTAGEPASSPLSAGQIAALVGMVVRTLARGQSVTVMSEGRMLARYLPTPAEIAEDESGGTKERAGRKP
jgi:hypothetical protein